jgi:hypothetical protein
MPCEEMGCKVARYSEAAILRQLEINFDASNEFTSLESITTNKPQRFASASFGVNVSPLPVPSDLKKVIFLFRPRVNRSSAM